MYDSLLSLIHSKFPDTKVVLSDMVCRKDKEFQIMIDYINASLSIEYDKSDYISMCKHPKLGLEYLWKDGVHLEDSGTSILASDLRKSIAKCADVTIKKNSS